MSLMGNDSGEIISTMEAKKLLGAPVFFRFETDASSKQELARLHQQDMLEYSRILDRANANLAEIGKPDPIEGLNDMYAERNRKTQETKAEVDSENLPTLNMYGERLARHPKKPNGAL